MGIENLIGTNKRSLSKEEKEFLLKYYVASIAWAPIQDGLDRLYRDIGKMYSKLEQEKNKKSI